MSFNFLAMKSIGKVFSSNLNKKYVTQAAAKKVEQPLKLNKHEPKVSRLPNGAVVASFENYSPLSRVSIMYNAGPRYEPANRIGITHYLRASSNLSTQKSTSFGIARNIQQLGGSLRCTTNREQMMYTVDVTRNNVEAAFGFLSQVATAPIFKPWELETAETQMRHDLAVYKQCLEARMVEGLHKAAYRETLGQSLYINEGWIGSIDAHKLEDYVKSHYVASSAAVIGVGIDHDVLVNLAKKVNFQNGNAPEAKKVKYRGGESRINVNAPFVHAAVVTEGVGTNSADLIIVYVLQQLLGSTPFVKHGSSIATSKVSKAASDATRNPVAASCISASYAESGLFGFQVAAAAEDIGKVLKSIFTTMAAATKGNISEAELQRAKNQLKALVHMENESSNELLEVLGVHVLHTGQLMPIKELESMVDKITVADINKVAKKILNGKPTLSVVGDLSSTPYLDELLV